MYVAQILVPSRLMQEREDVHDDERWCGPSPAVGTRTSVYRASLLCVWGCVCVGVLIIPYKLPEIAPSCGLLTPFFGGGASLNI